MNFIIYKKTFCFKHIVLICAMLAVTYMPRLNNVEAAELIIGIDNPPSNGTVLAMLFNSSSTFVDLRDPVTVITLPSGGTPLDEYWIWPVANMR